MTIIASILFKQHTCIDYTRTISNCSGWGGFWLLHPRPAPEVLIRQVSGHLVRRRHRGRGRVTVLTGVGAERCSIFQLASDEPMSRSWSNEPGQRHTCFDVVHCEIKIQAGDLDL